MKLILDAGHGGMSFGHYMTPGKRSPKIPPGIYEGEFNRIICGCIINRIQWYKNLGYEFVSDVLFLNPGPVNIPLRARRNHLIRLSNIIGQRDAMVISVHANAAWNRREWHRASGHVVFRRLDESPESEALAECIDFELEKVTEKSRGVKRTNFAILRNPFPSILVEYGFMTNEVEAKKLADGEYVKKLADATVEGVIAAKKELKLK